MSNSYHLKTDNSDISVAAKIGTIGIASTIVTKRRSGGSFEEIVRSTKTAAGNISKKKVGISNDLVGSTIVADLAVLLDGVPKNQLDQAFENLFFRVTLSGGLDGEQIFDVGPTEKKQFMDKRLVVASIAIKLITQTA